MREENINILVSLILECRLIIQTRTAAVYIFLRVCRLDLSNLKHLQEQLEKERLM